MSDDEEDPFAAMEAMLAGDDGGDDEPDEGAQPEPETFVDANRATRRRAP